jgi:hypothetical protein
VSLINRFLKKPAQPDLQFAAKGFTPIMMARMAGQNADFYALVDDFADQLLNSGQPLHQATSARWGGVTAMGQDVKLYESFLSAYEDVAAESGIDTANEQQRSAKYHSASVMMVTLVMNEAPAEYERFLQHIGRSS